MLAIQPRPLPETALLSRYAREGAYTDCYAVDVDAAVSHAQFVAAFYTTPLFKLERFILAMALGRPSTDDEVRQLANGTASQFAAWTVEARADNQLLLCDFQRRTRSWLMVEAHEPAGGPRTRLYFGSAVVPRSNATTGQRTMGLVFPVLLGFHKLYSRSLLAGASARLRQAR